MKMDMTFNFLLQATRVLHVNNYDSDELKLIYKYTTSLDNDILNDYYISRTILGYNNDLELYLEIVETLINIFEEMEDYEKCFVLKNKRDESLKIINNKNN